MVDKLTRRAFSAINCLLKGFERSANAGRWKHLEEALQRSDNYFYNGLLTILLRIVFLLYVEERNLLQIDPKIYNKYFSLFTLFSKLQQSHSKITRKQFGAWDHLITIFRVTYYGIQDNDVYLYPCKGDLFDPRRFDLLEGSNFSVRLVEPFKVSKSVIIDNKTVYLVLKKLLFLKGERLFYKTLNIGSVYEELMGYSIKRVDSSGCGSELIIGPNEERRRTGSHYTPYKLAKLITEKTVKPLISGHNPLSEDLLNLKICDPAMGSGVFLVAACRYLARQVVAAWDREGKMTEHSDKLAYAKQLVAQRCLYGVDKNPFVVSLAKLTLWLTVANKNLSFTFADHSLRCGDALAGLSFEQITAFHWKREQGIDFYYKELKSDLDKVLKNRLKILDLSASSSHKATLKKERLLIKADNHLKRLRLIGDLVITAYFGANKPKERKVLRNKLLSQLQKYLNSSSSFEELEDVQKCVRAFHWEIEFPEVFRAQRAKKGMDAFIGNTPFMGGNKISGTFGNSYRDWLLQLHEKSHGNADYSAHFFRRASTMLGDHGTMGFIATNTIAQGDTRSTGLQWLVNRGHIIYGAINNMPWPGNAAVAVSVCFLAKGKFIHPKSRFCRSVSAVINSRLRPKPERPDPQKLAANAGKSFQGNIVLGMGFTLTPDERDELIIRNPKNSELIFPYIGGKEVNTSPTQDFHRYVINFGQMSLEEAEQYPDLIQIVREKVKPERDKNKHEVRRKYWWRFGGYTPALFEAIQGLPRCLVVSRVTKHLIFSFQPTDRVFAHTLWIYPFQYSAPFALLQSRIHTAWTWLLSSTMRMDLNYSATDCFENFPFPEAQHLTPESPLEAIGKKLYEKRAHYMITTNQGLTKTYNKLKDSDCMDPPIIKLRELHQAMDQAVLKAYGWPNIPVPPYTKPTTAQEEKAQQAFEDEVLDRLFELNYQLSKKKNNLNRNSLLYKEVNKYVP